MAKINWSNTITPFNPRITIMRKIPVFLLALIMSTTLSYAAGDFFRFGNTFGSNSYYRNNMNNEINSTLNSMNRNNWSNPYAYNNYNNPVSRFFRNKNSGLNSNKYSMNSIKGSDVEYLLSRMERNRFGQEYSNLDIDNRLDRLDSQVFGAIQSGDYKTRLNRLKHAFSAESTRSYKTKKQKLNDFREFFSSGSPTSIPASEDYYSSLDNGFSAW